MHDRSDQQADRQSDHHSCHRSFDVESIVFVSLFQIFCSGETACFGSAEPEAVQDQRVVSVDDQPQAVADKKAGQEASAAVQAVDDAAQNCRH